MNESIPEDILLSVIRRVSRAEYDNLPECVAARMHDQMCKQIADFVCHAKAEKITKDHYHELRLELYVTTSDEFWEIVHKEAGKIAMRYYR